MHDNKTTIVPATVYKDAQIPNSRAHWRIARFCHTKTQSICNFKMKM